MIEEENTQLKVDGKLGDLIEKLYNAYSDKTVINFIGSDFDFCLSKKKIGKTQLRYELDDQTIFLIKSLKKEKDIFFLNSWANIDMGEETRVDFLKLTNKVGDFKQIYQENPLIQYKRNISKGTVEEKQETEIDISSVKVGNVDLDLGYTAEKKDKLHMSIMNIVENKDRVKDKKLNIIILDNEVEEYSKNYPSREVEIIDGDEKICTVNFIFVPIRAEQLEDKDKYWNESEKERGVEFNKLVQQVNKTFLNKTILNAFNLYKNATEEERKSLKDEFNKIEAYKAASEEAYNFEEVKKQDEKEITEINEIKEKYEQNLNQDSQGFVSKTPKKGEGNNFKRKAEEKKKEEQHEKKTEGIQGNSEKSKEGIEEVDELGSINLGRNNYQSKIIPQHSKEKGPEKTKYVDESALTTYLNKEVAFNAAENLNISGGTDPMQNQGDTKIAIQVHDKEKEIETKLKDFHHQQDALTDEMDAMTTDRLEEAEQKVEQLKNLINEEVVFIEEEEKKNPEMKTFFSEKKKDVLEYKNKIDAYVKPVDEKMEKKIKKEIEQKLEAFRGIQEEMKDESIINNVEEEIKYINDKIKELNTQNMYKSIKEYLNKELKEATKYKKELEIHYIGVEIETKMQKYEEKIKNFTIQDYSNKNNQSYIAGFIKRTRKKIEKAKNIFAEKQDNFGLLNNFNTLIDKFNVHLEKIETIRNVLKSQPEKLKQQFREKEKNKLKIQTKTVDCYCNQQKNINSQVACEDRSI